MKPVCALCFRAPVILPLCLSSRSPLGYFQLVSTLICVAEWQGNATRGSAVLQEHRSTESIVADSVFGILRPDCDMWARTILSSQQTQAKYSKRALQLSLSPTTSVSSASCVASSRCIRPTRCRPKSSSAINCFWKVPKQEVRGDRKLVRAVTGSWTFLSVCVVGLKWIQTFKNDRFCNV